MADLEGAWLLTGVEGEGPVADLEVAWLLVEGEGLLVEGAWLLTDLEGAWLLVWPCSAAALFLFRNLLSDEPADRHHL